MTDTAFSQAIRSLFTDAIQDLSPEDGVPPHELDEAEQQLGFRIPTPLHDYYAAAGNTSFNQSFNHFVAPRAIEVKDDMAIFCEEHQQAVLYGFKVADAEMEDPEVWQWNATEEKWYFECKRMTSFLLKMICWQAVCGGVSASAKGVLPITEYGQIEASYDRVEFGDIDDDYDLRAFHKDGVIVCAFLDAGRYHLYCGSNDEARMTEIAGQFGLDML